jgi:hypothetical protein
MAPTMGALVGRAAAVAEARGGEAALVLLKEIPIAVGRNLSALLGTQLTLAEASAMIR